MTEFLTALCLILVIEGLLYALFANAFKRFAVHILELPESSIRTGGVIAAAIGVFGIWLIRG